MQPATSSATVVQCNSAHRLQAAHSHVPLSLVPLLLPPCSPSSDHKVLPIYHATQGWQDREKEPLRFPSQAEPAPDLSVTYKQRM